MHGVVALHVGGGPASLPVLEPLLEPEALVLELDPAPEPDALLDPDA
jgi:hypothetical protein